MSLEAGSEMAPLVAVDGLCISAHAIDGREFPIVKEIGRAHV